MCNNVGVRGIRRMRIAVCKCAYYNGRAIGSVRCALATILRMEAEEEVKAVKAVRRSSIRRNSHKRDSLKRGSIKRDNLTGEKRSGSVVNAGYEAKYPVSE